MSFSFDDVKRLREMTDAPIMECKAALTEADGDFEKAKQILREKGQAAAAKRADRNTAAGVVAVAHSGDHKKAGVAVLECETDFVARNEGFIAVTAELAEVFLHNDPGTDGTAVKHGDKTVGTIVEETVAKFRENSKLTAAAHLASDNFLAVYVHHDNLKACIIELSGDADATTKGNIGRELAIQAVAFPPSYVSKDEIPAEDIAKEIDVEKQRAINEGKPENIAENIAKGRVQKEWLSKVVLLEQPFFRELSKTVGQFLKEEGKGVEVKAFHYYYVGATQG